MRFLLICLAVVLLHSCSPISRGKLTRTFKATEQRFKDHTGFVLYDPEEKKTVFDYQGDRYFTPASNTKIFTLYAGLKILGDSVPALRYIERGDSLIFWGTGDPSFLYSEVFHDSSVYYFLASSKFPLYFSPSNFHTQHFGEGWAWDDYSYGYSPERSAFPIFGNVVTVAADHQLLRITPDYFQPNFISGDPTKSVRVDRDQHANKFVIHPAIAPAEIREVKVPFRVDPNIICALLSDTLKREVRPTTTPLSRDARTLFSIHVDSLYSVMMQESDNFIAEQLLLMSANVLSDTLKPEIAIEYMKENHLNDLPDEPIWVDGSGLSRYNLFTPRSIVRLWEKISETVPRDRLFPLLATGGVNGTIRNWYRAEKPYIFGKTGSLSNNHCLSGFLVTKKGKVLIFSFMNSNFTESGSAIRRNMQEILEKIYEHY